VTERINFDKVDATMFLRDAARPDICADIFQWLGFADTVEWIFQNGTNQLKQSLSCASVCFNPMLKVF
jgi:hypothetical protein